MKTVTETFDIFTFDELSSKAKHKAMCYYEMHLTDWCVFTEDCEDVLQGLFPESNLKVEYDLGMGQGDYFNFYGQLALGDIYKHISSRLTTKQSRFYLHILKEWVDSCEIASYSTVYGFGQTATNISILAYATEAMENYGYSNLPYSDIEEINNIARDYLSDVCRSLKNDGYNYFYPDSDNIRDYYNANGYYFTVDGIPYYS